MSIECFRGHLRESPVPSAARVVAHQNIEVPTRIPSHINELQAGIGNAQINFLVLQLSSRSESRAQSRYDLVELVGSPGLFDIVRSEVLYEKTRTHVGEARGDGKPDSLTAAYPGDNSSATGEWQV